MYHVKAGGKNGYSFFSTEMNADFHQRLTVENDLRRALDGQELELRYQPQISLSRRQLVGMEALVRWRHPSQGLLDPARFIGVAEEAGLISRISDWVLDQVCAQLSCWRALGFGELRVGVNLSPREFEKGDVAERVFAALQRHRVAPQALEIEITENLMIRDVEPVVNTLQRLRDSGVRVSIDDFDTRYASFGYLQKFAVTSLKVDQTFVRDLSPERPYSPIISAIVGIAHGFDLHLIAEGVESPQQRDALRTLGCDEMQGYLFGQPLEAWAAEEVLRQGAAALLA
jgi:EAL domain-containing protein (putative c-di-GMP-specific phosphodiesterase class I)